MISTYWKPLAVIALMVLVYVRVSIIKAERDSALNELKELKASISIATAKKQAENAISSMQGTLKVQSIEAKHKEIGKRYGKDINTVRDNLANRLREQSTTNNTARVSENDTDQTTNENINSDFTRQDEYKLMYQGAQVYIQTLEQAGAVCAADYNLCKEYVDSEQQRLGVESN